MLYQRLLVLLLSTLSAWSKPVVHESSKALIHELTKDISLTELTEAPRLHISKAPQSHLAVQEGQSITLECGGVGVPTPIVYWRKNGHRVRQVEADGESNFYEKLTNLGGTTVESSSTIGRLHLDCMDRSMEGTYECVADNGFKKVVNATKVVVVARDLLNPSDYAEDSSADCVSRRPRSITLLDDDSSSTQFDDDVPLIEIKPRIVLHTEWRFEKEGNNVQLFCRASGVPRPEITWFNENMEAVEIGEKTTIMSNGDLFLRDVRQMGQYYCAATNAAGRAKVDTFLYVTKADEDNES